MAQPQPIEHFGKYQILERVAQGGMAEIYKARMEGIGGFNRLFAIKRILPSLSQNREYIDLLVDEAKVAGLLSHANIVQILDLGEVQGQYYVAMEYVDGRDLGRVLARCNKRGITLPVPHAVFILIEVLKGLEYAHNRQIMRGKTPMPLDIVHRDVSPSNVLASFQGEVKLTDFGIAKASVKALQTVSGVIKGKYDYMSPEQARGGELDPRTDLFAAGVLLYEMLCGVHPFRGGGDRKTIDAIRNGDYAKPTIANPDVPYSLELVLDRALALDPNERYQSATEFKEALTKFFHDAGFIFSHSTLAAFLKGLFPEASGRRRAKALKLKDQHTLPMPMPRVKEEQTQSRARPARPVRQQEQARVSFGPVPDDEDSFISLDSVSIASLTAELEEATQTEAELLLPNPIEEDPNPSRNFGPLSDPLDESTLLRPGAAMLIEAAQRSRAAQTLAEAEWADDNPTVIRASPPMPSAVPSPPPSQPLPSRPAPITREPTEELPELELDEPSSPPLPPQGRRVPSQQPAARPRASSAAAAPPRMGRRTQLLMAFIAISCLALGFFGGVLTGVVASTRGPSLASPGPIKLEPRLQVQVPQGASLTLDGRKITTPAAGPVSLTLRAGEPTLLRVELQGFAPYEQSITLDHNQERALDIQMTQLTGD